MTLRVAFQLDPLASLNAKTDTSLLLAFAAQGRGYEVLFFHPHELSLLEGCLLAQVKRLHLESSSEGFVAKETPSEQISLSELDVVLIRQDPPFDMSYITGTYLLEHIEQQTLILNSPRGIRNSAEKLLPLAVSHFMPPTLISQDWDQISQFSHEHEDIIIKPLYDYGGHSVFRSQKGDVQLRPLLDLLKKSYPGLPFIVQPFLEKVVEGDKRIILMDGDVVGAFSRVPSKGEIRSNMLMGGTPQACELDERDLEICQALRTILRDMGLFFVGLDVIDGYLIEINVTSPTGLVPLNRLNNMRSDIIFWEKVESKLRDKAEDGSKYNNGRLSGH